MAAPFMGVQLGSHSIYDESIDRVLDNLQETAGIDSVFVYATTYHGFAKNRKPDVLASDHGVIPPDPRKRDLTTCWFTPHEEHYRGTVLSHGVARSKGEFHDRDVFSDLAEPLKKRGMKLYGRILEGFGSNMPALMPNWSRILTVDAFGWQTQLPCFNNPDYIGWWLSTVEDLFTHYEFDGFKFGAERNGPLQHMFHVQYPTPRVTRPICFCEHCRAKARERGIDVARAREGMKVLYNYVSGLLTGTTDKTDGVMIGFTRLLLKYPEILAWEYMWYQTKEDLFRLLYGAAKAIQPEAQIGLHIHHTVSRDLFYRAEVDYTDLATYSDWIKPVVYHDISGPRLKASVVDAQAELLLSELTPEQRVNLHYAWCGFDPNTEPRVDELMSRGFSEEYVYREISRAVKAVSGRVPIYAGIGFDVPWQQERFPSDPDLVYKATVRAFEAGAKGLVVSREYDEMRLDNLRAVGRAANDVWAD